MYLKTKLPNNLIVVSSYMPQMKSVGLGIWIKTGSRYEKNNVKGIAHFLEHCVFKGTKNFSISEIKESIEGVGGSLNGFTSEEFTCYFVKIPAKYLKLSLEVLSDMVINPTIPVNEVERERGVILEEINMYEDLPSVHVYDLLDKIMWPHHALGIPIIGTRESIIRMTRKEIVNFKEEFYNPSNIIVSASGNLEHQDLVKYTKDIFGKMKPKKKSVFNRFSKSRYPYIAHTNFLEKDTQQLHLAIGFHALEREHPVRYALSLVHIILGANMSSRLFQEIREKKGLAYEIGTQIKKFYDTGAFIVKAGMDNQNLEKTVSLILEELGKIKKNLVSKDEFSRAKEFYKGQLSLALEDTLEHMLWV
ncbi:MAG: pitrilysin family protein, partial [Candidatus Omnitrophota bacterium]